MKKTLVCICLSVLSLIVFSGCGHNTALQTKGWGIDVSWSQDSFIPNMRLGYWDVSSAIVKENVEVEMASTGNLSSSSGTEGGKNSTSYENNSTSQNDSAANTTTTTDSTALKNSSSTNNSSRILDSGITKLQAGGIVENRIKMKTGQQINGYTKDVLTAPNLTKQNVDMAKAIFGVTNQTSSDPIPVEIRIKTDEKTSNVTAEATSRESNSGCNGNKINTIKITLIIER